VPSLDVRSWRSLIEHRRRLVGKRTRVKNSLKALLRSQGIVAPRGVWSKRGQAWLSTVELPTEADQLQRDLLTEELAELADKLKRVERELGRIAQRQPGVVVLTTIPGVGLRTAEAMLAYLDDPKRFSRNKAVGCYLGLVPRQDASGQANRLGHISREGPATVRQLLTEAAWQGVRRSPRIRQYFLRVQQNNPERKKIALVATAHYLARVMHAMLRTGEAWREERTAA
jgi:transposase